MRNFKHALQRATRVVHLSTMLLPLRELLRTFTKASTCRPRRPNRKKFLIDRLDDFLIEGGTENGSVGSDSIPGEHEHTETNDPDADELCRRQLLTKQGRSCKSIDDIAQ